MLTIGGLPETEALTWNHDTFQRLGQIVYCLVSGNPEKRQQGYQDYHELRRGFMEDQWELKLSELRCFRLARGMRPLEVIVEGVGSEAVEHKKAQIAVPESPEMPKFETPCLDRYHKEQAKSVDVEQLSLF